MTNEPKILELGCGTQPTPGCVHHDKTQHHPYVDFAWDLDVLPWDFPVKTKFDKIVALDVMEHLHAEVSQWLNECRRWLKPGGLLVLRLPAWNHENSWADPTHYFKAHARTFDYWDPEKELHQKYGSVYFPEKQWWHIEDVQLRDADANLAYVLRKLEP